MERLSPKGDKSIEAVPLGRMGDGGKFSFSPAFMRNRRVESFVLAC